MSFGGAPKPDTSAIEAQRKQATEERERLATERQAAEATADRELEKRNKAARAGRLRRAGRGSLITNTGGELGQSSKLG